MVKEMIMEKARTTLRKTRPAATKIANFTLEHKEKIIVGHHLTAHTVSTLIVAPLVQLQPFSSLLGQIANIDQLYRNLQKELLGL